MSSEKIILSDSFRLTEMEAHIQDLGKMAHDNPDYLLKEDDLIDQGLINERIYEKEYTCSETTVSETEDQSDLQVTADGITVGKIRRSSVSHARNLIRNYKVTGAELLIRGGRYHLLRETSEGFTLETGDAALSASVTIYYEKGTAAAGSPSSETPAVAAAPSSSSNDEAAEESGWIDTTYATIEKEKDPASRGLVFLILAAMLMAAYLCFSVPYWITNRSGQTALWDLIGQDIDNRILLIHAGCLGAGFLFNLIAMFSRKCRWCILCALCYAASVLLMPHYVIFTGASALLAVLASFRKSSGSGLLKFLFFLITAGATAFCGWQYYTGKTILHLFSSDASGDDSTSLTSDDTIIFPSGEDDEADIYADEEYETDDDWYEMEAGGYWYEDETGAYWVEGESEDWYEEDDGEVWYEDENGDVWYEEETGDIWYEEETDEIWYEEDTNEVWYEGETGDIWYEDETDIYQYENQS